MSPSCTPTTRQRCGPAERFADDCIGETLTGCAGVDDDEIGVGNDGAGAAGGAGGCVAEAMAAAEPATIGGASVDDAHWLGGGAACGTAGVVCWTGAHDAVAGGGGGASAGAEGCG